MEKLLLPLLLLTSSISFAQEAEVWACINKHSTGFRPNGTDWERVNFKLGNFLFKIDGENSEYDGEEVRCETRFSRYVVCNSILGSDPIFFNTVSGLGTSSSLFGGTDKNTEDGDTVNITLMECTKF